MQTRKSQQTPKNVPQFGLQAATRLHEAGIARIADQNAAVNVFLSLVHTARQATKVGGIRSRRWNRKDLSA